MRQQRVAEIGHDGVWLQPVKMPSPYAGAYVIGDCWIWLQQKPTWLQRHLVQWLLGWRWVPAGPAVKVALVTGQS